jgi:hypothetical protein
LPPEGRHFNPHRRRVRREEKIREEAVLRERIFIPIRFSDRERMRTGKSAARKNEISFFRWAATLSTPKTAVAAASAAFSKLFKDFLWRLQTYSPAVRLIYAKALEQERKAPF